MKIICVKNHKDAIQIMQSLGSIFKQMTSIKKNRTALSGDNIPALVSNISEFNNHGAYLDYLADKWYTLKVKDKKIICEMIAGEFKDDLKVLMDGYYKPLKFED